MNFKEQIKKIIEFNEGIAEAEKMLQALKIDRDNAKLQLLAQMKDAGVARVINEEIGVNAIASTRKSIKIVNDIQAISVLNQHNIPSQNYMNPDRRKIVSILSEMKKDGIEVAGIEEVETDVISFKLSEKKN